MSRIRRIRIRRNRIRRTRIKIRIRIIQIKLMNPVDSCPDERMLNQNRLYIPGKTVI